ncbi:MAG: helix-turn-helix transcriptional regulator [Chloroflexi bacterium]|nr:helix-turn-helix transcriptional regulator [Chloroflexota bacterium]
MRGIRFGEMDCSIARTLDIVGERWALLILREAFNRVRRFEDFQQQLGIARNILTDRLQTLVAHDILERRLYQEHPERFEYRLTQKGLDLFPVLISLMDWGDRYLCDDAGPPVKLEHMTCGHEAVSAVICTGCGESLTARDTRSAGRALRQMSA